MKKLLLILISLFAAMLTTACAADVPNREHIRSVFNEHEALFLEAVERSDYTELENLDAIEKVRVSDSCVEFFLGGAGFGSETSYCGIFYSAEDNLFAPYGTGPTDQLAAHEAGYLYQQDKGDNRYYVEPLGDHFYFYEAEY